MITEIRTRLVEIKQDRFHFTGRVEDGKVIEFVKPEKPAWEISRKYLEVYAVYVKDMIVAIDQTL